MSLPVSDFSGDSSLSHRLINIPPPTRPGNDSDAVRSVILTEVQRCSKTGGYVGSENFLFSLLGNEAVA